MKIKLITAACVVFFCTSSLAQLFEYDDSSRRVLVDGTNFGDTSTTINNEFGYWHFDDAIGSTSDGTYAGALQISNLGSNSICARSYVWNSIHGSHPSGGDAQTSVITSFSLTEEARFKINFFDAVHSNTYQGYLFIEPQLFLKAGLTGSGETILNIAGSGVEYVDVPAGDYRITTAVGASYNCSNDPKCTAFISGQSKLSMTPIDTTLILGESYHLPFTPNSYLETQSPDHMSVTPEGAFIIRGLNSSYTYLDQTDGWFDIGGESQSFIEMQSSGIISELELPENRQGIFQINVGEVLLGEFSGTDVITFADYSAELGSLLHTGEDGLKGVMDIEINYNSITGDNINNLCGDSNNSAVRLAFDQTMVSFNVVMPFTPIPDNVFADSFEK